MTIPSHLLEEARVLCDEFLHLYDRAGEEVCKNLIALALSVAEQRGREMEREACAVQAETLYKSGMPLMAGKVIAAAIRHPLHRSEEPKP